MFILHMVAYTEVFEKKIWFCVKRILMADEYETKRPYGNEFDRGESLPFDTLKFQLD